MIVVSPLSLDHPPPEESKMTFYKSSKIQDLAKSMLEVQARIKNSLMNMFWTSRNQETLKKYSEDNQDSRYLFASFCHQERHKISTLCKIDQCYSRIETINTMGTCTFNNLDEETPKFDEICT